MQCLTVSVNYADFLAYTLPANVSQFDKMIVLTEEQDKATRKLCAYYDVECLLVEGNKGKKLNEGLKRLRPNDWVLQMDADIYLPPQTINIIKRKDLDKETLWGADRAMCQSYADFLRFLSSPSAYPEKFFTVPPFPLGARVAQHYGIGYIPIGYFQLWHPLGSAVFSYPTDHETEGSYARTDVVHAKKFSERGLIPEIFVVHLEEGKSKMGANWNGRTTPLFGIESLEIAKTSYEN